MLKRLLFLLIPLSCLSQNQFRFDHFSIKDGLSQNTVNCILRDREGYYWFGTQDGLNRYDGYSVKVFRHDRDDTCSISDNFILNITEDKFGNFWIGTRNGLNHFDKRKGIFTRIIANEKERSYFHSSVWNVVEDNKGDILFSNYYYQLVKITGAEKPPFTISVIADKTTLVKSSPNTYCLFDHTSEQIACYDSRTHRERWRMADTLKGHIRILETGDGNIVLGEAKGAQVTDPAHTHQSTFLENKDITCFMEDSRKNIWAGTYTGLYLFQNGLQTSPQLITHNAEDIHSLASNNVQGLYEDADGLIWVGTSEGGVSVFDPGKNRFSIFNHSSAVPLSSNPVWGIYQDKNELWVSTSGGLNRLTFESGSIADVYKGKNKLLGSQVFVRTSAFPNSVCSNFITCITKDKEGNLWFGSHDDGISIYAPSVNKWTHLNTKNSGLKSDHIFHLLCASDGKIWISTLSGFYSYDPAATLLQSFLPRAQGGDFPSGYIISTYEDRDGTLWVASTAGMAHVKNNGEVISLYASEPDNPKTLSYNIVTSFFQDSKGNIWVATLGGGINLFQRETNTFRSFTVKDGLPNGVAYWIREDKAGNLWISTNSGLSRFNLQDHSFFNYTEKDGLPANEFCQNAGFRNENGELLFGSPEGLVAFDPGEFKTEEENIPLILSSLKINYEERPYVADAPLDLYYNDKTITFEFSAPDFRRQEKIHYSFLLEGFTTGWHEVTSSSRSASFTNLPFGEYTFKVRVKVGNGEWQKNPLAIKMNVIPPFWLRTWFITLIILSGVFLIVLLVRYYSQRNLRKRLREIELQQKIHLEKERISRDLHDNVGSHLTYIITSLDNISFRKEKGETIPQEKISALSDFSRDTMQQLRESIWAINKESVLLTELKEKIADYSGKMTAAANMDFEIHHSNGNKIPLAPSHAINIYRIVQEAINNAVKHSRASSLAITIEEYGVERISIEVRDNGKGISEKGDGPGYGIKNMEDRVKELKGELNIHSSGTEGTRVRILVPL